MNVTRARLCFIVVAAVASPAWAEVGFNLLYKSNGEADIVGWKLTDNGFAGTYITMASPGQVTLTVNAHGMADGGIDPRMNLAIGDTKKSWDVGTTATDYEHTFDLPAGTHLVRVEFDNDVYTAAAGGTARSLTINTLDVSGATMDNGSGTIANANALAAADTYIENNRKGNATLYMPAIQPGTPVHVKLKTHEFNFGVGVPNSFTDTLLIENPQPGSDAANFQQALVDSRFNSMTPTNAGKWVSNEGTRDVLTAQAFNPNGPPNVIPLMDRYMDYAEENNMRFRQHNMLWGRSADGVVNQQPIWSDVMLQDPTGIDPVSGDVRSVALRDEISERIDYYITDRANRYYELDIYNESYHTGVNHSHIGNTYWEVYGVDGIASIYKEAKDAAEAVGADVGLYVNEYNVVQQEGGDVYANWYMRHYEDLQNSGRALYGEDVVTGIGFQYYSSGTTSDHNPSRIYAVMHNLAAAGLPITLTEWGANGGTQSHIATVLDETARLLFGMPGATGITLFNLQNSSGFAADGRLYNINWSLRPAGTAWQALMSAWDTDEMINVAGDGTIDFSGFYGDYEITVGSQTFDLTFGKGGASDFLFYDFTTLGDTDGDGDVDIDDLVNVKNNMGSTSAGFAQGDTDGDGDVDGTDLSNVKDFFGNVVTPGPPPGLTFVPEPASLGLMSVGGLMLTVRGGMAQAAAIKSS